MPQRKVQTNLKLDPRSAAALDISAAVEGKDKAEIVQEALRIREELLGADYSALIQAAVRARFAEQPEDLLAAAEALRGEGSGPHAEGFASADLVLARLRARAAQPA